jgi:hypothetical protein
MSNEALKVFLPTWFGVAHVVQQSAPFFSIFRGVLL